MRRPRRTCSRITRCLVGRGVPSTVSGLMLPGADSTNAMRPPIARAVGARLCTPARRSARSSATVACIAGRTESTVNTSSDSAPARHRGSGVFPCTTPARGGVHARALATGRTMNVSRSREAPPATTPTGTRKTFARPVSETPCLSAASCGVGHECARSTTTPDRVPPRQRHIEGRPQRVRTHEFTALPHTLPARTARDDTVLIAMSSSDDAQRRRTVALRETAERPSRCVDSKRNMVAPREAPSPYAAAAVTVVRRRVPEGSAAPPRGESDGPPASAGGSAASGTEVSVARYMPVPGAAKGVHIMPREHNTPRIVPLGAPPPRRRRRAHAHPSAAGASRRTG